MRHPFRVYGHRGAARHHPENTMRSFRAAIEAGADAIETDVRLSSDGRVVVFHDADGARTCGRPDRVLASCWSDISRWDAGDGECPVLLSDLLEQWPDVFVNIDVKDDLPDAANAVVSLIRDLHPTRVGLGSFHPRVASAIRAAGWQGQLALVPREVAAVRLLPRPMARWLVGGSAAQIPTHSGRFRLDAPWFIERCHALGLRVDYWTIDDPDQAVALARAGADGIVTNDPATIRAALRSAGYGQP